MWLCTRNQFSGERTPRLDQAGWLREAQTGRSIKFQNKFFVELSRPPRPLPLRRLRHILLVLKIAFVLVIALSFQIFAAPQEVRIGLRLLAVRSEAEASSLRAQIQAGASFQALAKAHSIDPSAKDGGYLGLFRPADLNSDFQRALERVMPGQVSPVIPSGREFVLLQRLSSEEANWIASNDAGIQAFEKERYDEAAQSFLRAVQYAEKLTPVDVRLEDSLHGLAESYRLQKKYAEAEPIYRRYLAVHWGGASTPEVLDRCSALIGLTYFRDSQFDDALRKFQEAVNRAPLGEDLYQAMSGILFKAQLIPEAETLMVHAVQLFPGSKDVRFHLAQLYLTGGKSKKALETFEQLSRMKAPAGIDPALDRLQQSVVYQKIGSIHAELAEFDQASSAYKTALGLTPDGAEVRLGLGDVYLRQGKPDAALAEYNPVAAADPMNVPAHFRIADASLQLERFAEAAAAAAKALAIDSQHRRARYILATALLRMDRKEEGEKELELYRKLEADSRAELDRGRNIVVLNRGAAGKLLEGKPEEAIGMFSSIIEIYPDSPAHYLNLGTIQSKLGRHQAAIDTLQKMLKLGMDSFMVYRNLAQEYQLLGDRDASIRHEVVYLQNLDVALREALEWNLE